MGFTERLLNMYTDPNASVSPIHGSYDKDGNNLDDPRNGIIQGGISIRTYIATQAMQGLIANAPDGHLSNSREGVELAVTWADALIEQLNKEK